MTALVANWLSPRRRKVTWPKVATLFVLVAGGVVAAIFKEKEIALVLCAAAATYVVPGREPPAPPALPPK